jgi:hypothetical protein
MVLLPCPYLDAEAELGEERERHIRAHHPDLLPEHRSRIMEVVGEPDQVRQSSRVGNAKLFTKWFDESRRGGQEGVGDGPVEETRSHGSGNREVAGELEGRGMICGDSASKKTRSGLAAGNQHGEKPFNVPADGPTATSSRRNRTPSGLFLRGHRIHRRVYRTPHRCRRPGPLPTRESEASPGDPCGLRRRSFRPARRRLVSSYFRLVG